ncbi:hypothetical protein LX32DRAFT_433623 [Colletotrichum zoysiae]|uniref:Uncharacterized protein n=1 Tax=Colletotrichum zoysiae TaxID=1216348 RepID=A0AAD9HF87_9PEZI|nr:hypothetical protein LX32DRAFT_433623 [Colletotrichum zoysiae]
MLRHAGEISEMPATNCNPPGCITCRRRMLHDASLITASEPHRQPVPTCQQSIRRSSQTRHSNRNNVGTRVGNTSAMNVRNDCTARLVDPSLQRNSHQTQSLTLDAGNPSQHTRIDRFGWPPRSRSLSLNATLWPHL